jgi:hypothetical protein
MRVLAHDELGQEFHLVAQLRQLSPYWGEAGPVTEPEKSFEPVYG